MAPVDMPTSEAAAPAAPPRRRWLWRVLAYGLGVPLFAVVALLAYSRLTALPTPDTIEELLPGDVLLYIRLDRAGQMVAGIRGSSFGRALLGLDAKGRSLPNPERVPLDDKDSLEDEIERRANIRQLFTFIENFLPGSFVAARLGSSDPGEAHWLLVAEVEGTAGDGLIGAVRGLLWLKSRPKSLEHRGVPYTVYVDAEEAADSVHVVRLGRMVVVGLGTGQEDYLIPLIERYLGAGRRMEMSLADSLISARASLGQAAPENAERHHATVYSFGSGLAKSAAARAAVLLARSDESKAEDELELVELLGPFRMALVDLATTPEGWLVAEGVGQPSNEDYRRIRGFVPGELGEAPEVLAMAASPALTLQASGPEATARLMEWLADMVGGLPDPSPVGAVPESLSPEGLQLARLTRLGTDPRQWSTALVGGLALNESQPAWQGLVLELDAKGPVPPDSISGWDALAVTPLQLRVSPQAVHCWWSADGAETGPRQAVQLPLRDQRWPGDAEGPGWMVQIVAGPLRPLLGPETAQAWLVGHRSADSWRRSVRALSLLEDWDWATCAAGFERIAGVSRFRLVLGRGDLPGNSRPQNP